jgi:hypothetical protein
LTGTNTTPSVVWSMCCLDGGNGRQRKAKVWVWQKPSVLHSGCLNTIHGLQRADCNQSPGHLCCTNTEVELANFCTRGVVWGKSLERKTVDALPSTQIFSVLEEGTCAATLLHYSQGSHYRGHLKRVCLQCKTSAPRKHGLV